MSNLVNINTNFAELTPGNGTSIIADDNLVNDIMSQLTKVLNSHGFKFTNIKLLDQIYYQENPRGKEIELFNISADISYRDAPMGSLVISLEIFMRKDRICPKEFTNGLLTITNVKLIDRKYIMKKNTDHTDLAPRGQIDSPSQYQRDFKTVEHNETHAKAQQKNQQLTSKMTESFNNYFVDIEENADLFIKPSNNENIDNGLGTENSLIPSIIRLSSYEQPSNTEST
jgi:hypothetical protein